ncbi:MAG TPA: hypothetical protein VH437_15335 [Terriglobales bacterium]|jgi:hypothetical protein
MIFSPRLRDPRILMAIVAALLAAVVQSGELGSADTMHRLQTTHAMWTQEPQVFPQEFPEFGLHGRNGKLYSWYGMGQSLIMLPADIVGTYISRLSIFANYDDSDPSVRNIVVSYTTNIVLSVLTSLVCFRFLLLLGLTPTEAISGVLALLFATSHLHYTQNMMENNYILLLTLAGFTYQYEWLRKGTRKALIIGSLAFGLNLLTRVTTALDLVAGGVFLFLVLGFEGMPGDTVARVLTYLKTTIPIYSGFALIERTYSWYRFGSFFRSYIHVFAEEYHRLDPTLPANFPWETPFHVGFAGALFAPEKSIFLFDPLLVLTLIVTTLAWKRFAPQVRAYILTALLLVLGYISFYARYTVWSGDFAWGDRYVSTAVQLAAFISVPLLVKYGREFGTFLKASGAALIALSVLVQFASLAFWLPLEIYQMETLGHPTFVIALRLKNIAAFALGKMDAWGLTNHAMTEDPWDYVHITTWNFLPFVLRRIGEAPSWVVNTVFTIWAATVSLLLWMLARLLSIIWNAE